MQKFYKYFTVTVLAVTILWLGYSVFPAKIGQKVEAQNKDDLHYGGQNVYVLSDTPTLTLHLVYDFERGKVHLVQLQKNFNPMVFTVTTKNLSQP